MTGVGGIGKTRLIGELAGELHTQGTGVLYVSGAASAGDAAARPRGRRAARAGLLVFDDLDRASHEIVRGAAELAAGAGERSLLVVLAYRDARRPPSSVGWPASSRRAAPSGSRCIRSARTACARSPPCTRESGPPRPPSSGCWKRAAGCRSASTRSSPIGRAVTRSGAWARGPGAPRSARRATGARGGAGLRRRGPRHAARAGRAVRPSPVG